MSEDMAFQRSLLDYLSSLIDGMKTLNHHVSGHIEAIGRFDVEFTKISRQNNQLATNVLNVSSEMAQFRMETSQKFDSLFNRLEAMLLRLDEIENAVDGNSRQIKELSTDVRSQYNDILTALQHGVQNSVAIRELADRIEAIERRLGM